MENEREFLHYAGKQTGLKNGKIKKKGLCANCRKVFEMYENKNNPHSVIPQNRLA